MNKHTQALLLTDWFFKHVKGLEKNNKGVYPGTGGYKKAVLDNAYDCLSSDYSFEFLKRIILMNKELFTDCYNIQEFIQLKTGEAHTLKTHNRKPNECIVLGMFYYHPKLQESSKAPRYELDSKTMEIRKVEQEPFFLEIKESFLTTDVLQYYYEKHMKEPLPGRGPLTQIQNLLGDYSLDMVLYMIDASATAMHDEGRFARAPAFLPEYLEDAKGLLNNKKQISREGGLTRVRARTDYSKT